MKVSILRAIGVLGMLLFGALFAFTYSTPTWVEEYAVQFIETEVRERVDGKIDGLELPKGDGALARTAAELFDRARGQVEQRREQLKARIHESFEKALAQVRRSDCECRVRAQLVEAGAGLEAMLVDATTRRLDSFIQSTYMEVANGLKRDLRIFTASNFAVFLLLLVASFTRRDLADWLFVPGLLLGASAIFCTYCYVFDQNWLLTLVYRQYTGYAYLFGIWFVFLFLLDVALNRARVTINLLHSQFGLKPPFECS
jgi:hypothetical protein